MLSGTNLYALLTLLFFHMQYIFISMKNKTALLLPQSFLKVGNQKLQKTEFKKLQPFTIDGW